jgi:hypothetical protein
MIYYLYMPKMQGSTTPTTVHRCLPTAELVAIGIHNIMLLLLLLKDVVAPGLLAVEGGGALLLLWVVQGRGVVVVVGGGVQGRQALERDRGVNGRAATEAQKRVVDKVAGLVY